MKLQPGQILPHFELPTTDGSTFSSAQLQGHPALVAFFRFATCPFCNLRLNALLNLHPKLPPNFQIIAIFESPLEYLAEYAPARQSTIPILANPDCDVYDRFGVERSVAGMMKGMATRIPTLLKGVSQGHIPTTTKGLTRMPAEFLVLPDHSLAHVHYGADEGDHLPLETILSFAQTAH